MKERQILFSAPMVRAILDGRKTQTRRIVKPQPEAVASLRFLIPRPNASGSCAYFSHVDERGIHSNELTVHCPYGMPGDRLWVREAWRITANSVEEARAITEDIMSGTAIDWRATYADRCVKELGFSREDAAMADRFEKWRPSIHMPRWASRITLEVTAVRVERLQDISEADAKAEGVESVRVSETDFRYVNYLRSDRTEYPKEATCGRPAQSFATLWESINGPGSWAANPWVWVVEFKRLEGGAVHDGYPKPAVPVSLTGNSTTESFVKEGGVA